MLVRSLAIGAAVFALRVGLRSEDSPRSLRVAVATGASRQQIEAQINEAILLEEARRYGWDHSDPVVFTHLVRNMRFLEPNSPANDRELFEQAVDLGLHGRDPVVRDRLLYRANRALLSVPKAAEPSDVELGVHLQRHRSRFVRAPIVTLRHVYLSRERGKDLRRDATTLDLSAPAPGDPLPGLGLRFVGSSDTLRHRVGDALGDAADTAPLHEWQGPIASAFGLHFLRVEHRREGRVPALSSIREEVRADYLRELRQRLHRQRFAALRRAYTVHVEHRP